jgi:PhoPQ-activated pathogenicity-related protein
MKRLACGLVLLLTLLAHHALAAAPTALDEYVAKPDASFRWKQVETIEGIGCTAYILDLTSQSWPKATNQTEWQHYVQVIVPNVVTGNTAFLLIDGGSTRKSPPDKIDTIAMMTGLQTNSISIYLPNVPNQPLKFADEDFDHSEDGIVCYTFDKFMNTGDTSWPAYLPMVNSAIRTMDAVQEFVRTIPGKSYRVDQFVLAGGSKRGWTTWLATAVDPKSRVKGMIPAVADLANLAVQMEYHRQTYQGVSAGMSDGYSVALSDWLHYKVIQRFPTPEGKALLDIVDPCSYFDRPNMQVPKYLVYGANDEYFTPGSANNYFDKLQGPSYLRYTPNAGHKLNLEAVQGLVNFYQAVRQDQPLPKFDWAIQDEGRTIEVKTVDPPEAVLLWQTTNPDSADFRLATFGPHWTSAPLTDQGNGVYRAQLALPKSGATASLVELEYRVGGKPIKFSSSISVLRGSSK